MAKETILPGKAVTFVEKLKINTAAPKIEWDALRHLPGQPWAQRVLRLGKYVAAGFVLSGCRFFGAALPASVCLIAALGATTGALWSFLGSVLGCLLLWDSLEMLMPLGAGFLALIFSWAVEDFPLSKKPWFPAVSALVSGLITGGLVLISGPVMSRSLLLFSVQLLLLPFGSLAAREILRQPDGSSLCAALFVLVSGCSALILPGGISAGAIAAAGCLFSLAGTSLSCPAAVLAGLALDMSLPSDGSSILPLTAAVLAASLLPREKRWSRLALFLGANAAGVLLAGGENAALLPASVLGAGAAALLPPIPLEDRADPREALRRELRLSAGAMEQIYQQVLDSPREPEAASEFYCRAADRVCSRCGKQEQCRLQEEDRVLPVLAAAAPVMIQRGQALRDDLPPEFRGQCRMVPELYQALNEELLDVLRQQQRQRRHRELRAVLGSQYRILSDYLQRCIPPARMPLPRFVPHAACRHQSKEGSSVSGDRAVCFCRNADCFLLLCDGMGTGPEAAEDSRSAIRLLTALLRGGMGADDALETLNISAILLERGGFSTVDLAWINLRNGEGVLYKWGGGPAYLRTGTGVKRMGTASLPPGLGVGGTHQAQQFRLSLGKGEVLLLTSDGVGGEVSEALLREGEFSSPEELAAGVIRHSSSGGDDDRTAAVLLLRPVSAQ